MTQPHVLAVALLALLTALGAAVAVVPRPPRLDGRRWFATLLARALGDEARVPFHPLDRWVERKLAHPTVERLPGAPLPGEPELLAALAALPDPQARWRWLREAGRGHLLREPPELSDDHLPARWLGPGHRWDAARDDATATVAEARLHARWVLVDGGAHDGVPDLAPAFDAFAAVIDGRVRDGEVDVAVERVRDALLAALPDDDRSARLIVAGSGDGVPVLLRVLHAEIALRDRVVAVLSVHGAIGGGAGDEGGLDEATQRDWLDAHFRHLELDTEAVREVPYLAMQWLDPTAVPLGAGGLAVDRARFGEPGFVAGEPATVLPVDLGALDATDPPPAEAVVRALRLTTALYALSRR